MRATIIMCDAAVAHGDGSFSALRAGLDDTRVGDGLPQTHALFATYRGREQKLYVGWVSAGDAGILRALTADDLGDYSDGVRVVVAWDAAGRQLGMTVNGKRVA